MGLRNFAEGLEEHALPVRYLRIGEHPYCGFADALSKECLCFFHIVTCLFLDTYYVTFNRVIYSENADGETVDSEDSFSR